MFLARHHGLPVRLLDWTSNPLVALYWACYGEDSNDNNGAIWAFRRRAQEHDLDVFFPRMEPLQIRGVRIIQPFHVSPRMAAQSSVFTIQDSPWQSLDQYLPSEFTSTDFDIERLEKWIVASNDKHRFLLDLELVGVNSRTLFPDLDGLARGILETEILRTGVERQG